MPTKYTPEIYFNNEDGDSVSYILALIDASADLDRAVSVDEIIGSNGAKLDDSGSNVGRYRFRAAFLGSSDLGTASSKFPTIEDGEEIFAHFKENGDEAVFVHPSLGAIHGRVKTISRREADEIDALFFDFTFLEEGVEPEAVIEVDVIPEVERGFRKTIEDERSNFSDDVTSRFGAEGADLLALDLDPEKSLLDQVGDFSKSVRDFANNIDEELASFDSFLTEITNPANSLIAVINYGTDLPGRVLGSIAKVGERYKEAYNSLLDAPSKFIESLKQGLEDMESAFTGSETEKSLKAVNSQNLALGAAQSYELDQERRLELKKIENSDSFDSEGNLINREPSPGEVQSLQQIERSLAETRGFLQSSIDGNRATNEGGEVDGIKISSEALLFHVTKTKAEIDRIRTVEIVSGFAPLHLILTKEKEPFNKAERVLSLNEVKNPTFISGEVLIYAG